MLTAAAIVLGARGGRAGDDPGLADRVKDGEVGGLAGRVRGRRGGRRRLLRLRFGRDRLVRVERSGRLLGLVDRGGRGSRCGSRRGRVVGLGLRLALLGVLVPLAERGEGRAQARADRHAHAGGHRRLARPRGGLPGRAGDVLDPRRRPFGLGLDSLGIDGLGLDGFRITRLGLDDFGSPAGPGEGRARAARRVPRRWPRPPWQPRRPAAWGRGCLGAGAGAGARAGGASIGGRPSTAGAGAAQRPSRPAARVPRDPARGPARVPGPRASPAAGAGATRLGRRDRSQRRRRPGLHVRGGQLHDGRRRGAGSFPAGLAPFGSPGGSSIGGSGGFSSPAVSFTCSAAGAGAPAAGSLVGDGAGRGRSGSRRVVGEQVGARDLLLRRRPRACPCLQACRAGPPCPPRGPAVRASGPAPFAGSPAWAVG